MAQVTAGYAEYYVPGGENEMSLAFRSLGANPTNNTHATITITAWADNIAVYYDHWEDGIDFDPTNPGATADETFTLATIGTVLTLDNTPVGGIPIPRNAANTYYDGGDRIYVAGGAVTVTRASYPETRGGVTPGLSVQAVAWEVYPIKPQLTTYILPFGENLSGSFPDFLRTYVLVQATANGTTFTVDLNGDGTAERLDQNFDGDTIDAGDTTTVTLQAGQTFFLGNVPVNPNPLPRGARATVNSGAIIQGSSTLQVKFVVGDPSATYETRGISAFPRGYWTRDYYAPVGQATSAPLTDIFLYNPNASSITVDWETRTGNGSFTIGAGVTVSYRAVAGALPTGGGVYLRGSDVFWGVSTIDSTGPTNEWAYSLLPSTLLYQEHFLGWAPGGADGNDSGVFLTVVQDNTRVFVDTNADGTADQTYTLDRLQTQYITDTDGDLSGTHFWATGPFTMSFGQNPDTAPAQALSGDLGYVAIPGMDFISLVLTVDKAADPQIVPTAAGSTTTFTIRVNSARYTVNGVHVTDYLPAGWAYVNNSTTITRPDKTQLTGSGANPTITGAGPYTLDWSSAQVGGQMAENQEIVVTFTARTTAVLAVGTLSQNRVKAVGTRTVGGVTQTFTATDFAYVVSQGSAGTAVQITKASSVPAATPLYPADPLTYTTTVTNPAGSGTTLTGVTLYDPMPAGVTYVPGSGSVTCERSRNVRDEFATVAYNNNGPNNTDNWTTNWTETDAYGTGATGATGGLVWITGGALQFRYLASNVADNLDTSSYSRNDGTNDWTSNWVEAGDDNNPGTGTITVDAGNNNRVNFGPGAAGRAITRTAAVSGNSATISFTLSDNGIDDGEGVIAEYDLGLGAGFQFIQQINNNVLSGTNPLTISTAGATSITLRFTTFGSFENGPPSDNAGVDTVNIAFNDTVGSRIQRTVDLTGATSPLLTFSTSRNGLEAADILVIEASSDPAGPFTTLATCNGTADTCDDNPLDLTPYISATTTVRFRVSSGFDGTGEYRNIDNVDISYSATSTFASGSAPDFLSAATGCRIRPGGSPVTLTFGVTVDDPLPTGLTSITNTASTTSTQLPIQVSASVTNIVTNPSVQSASVAGRVWLDSDGDGVQDLGETGIANVEVTLKDRWGTPVAMLYTDVGGRYLFPNVEPGIGYYVEATAGVPSGVSQSFPVGSSNNRTSAFDLASGQSYTTADLGYRPASGTAIFGDQVWVDANANGLRDAGEVGLGGATINLYADTNGNGRFDYGTDALVDTRTSGPDGHYLFTGVTAGSSYFVIAQTPTGYAPTTTATFYFPSVAAGSANLTADFGFNGTTYTISDRVWFDLDGDGLLGGSENGISGVTVDLLDASLNVIGTTVTGANGTFTFSGVKGGGANYTVRISDTSGVLADYTGTTSYALARQRAVTNVTGNVDWRSTPSYGFRPTRSIGDTVYYDVNGDGDQDAGDSGIPGVVVSLYTDANGDGVINGTDAVLYTTTTDANGQYFFAGLTSASYTVSVPVPSGYTFRGPGTDSNSNSADGIQKGATIAAGVSVWTVDYGFQANTPRALSGAVWNDTDADGVIDAGETGIAGVTLDVASGGIVVAIVTTDASGAYSVQGLASGTYTVALTDTNGVLTGLTATYENTEHTTGPFNYQEIVNLTAGDVTNVNFGYRTPPVTFAGLAYLKAYLAGGSVVVEWRTSVEVGTLGFQLFRLDPTTQAWERLGERLLPGLIGHPQGGTYRFVDARASAQDTLTYALVEVDVRGQRRAHGPYRVSPSDEGAAPAAGARREMRGVPFDREPASMSRAALARIRAAAVERQAAVVTRRGRRGGVLEVTTGEAGLYYLGAAQIAGPAGLPMAAVRGLIRARQLAVLHRGLPVRYLPDARDTGIFFYAEPVGSIYTTENVYQLGIGSGLTMDVIGSDWRGRVATSFQETLHREVNQYPAPVVFQDPESDFWVWEYLFSGYAGLDTKTLTVRATGVAGTGTASLTLHMVGGSDDSAELDHHVTFSWNGRPVGEASWGGFGPHEIEIPMTADDVLEGDNTLELRAVRDAGVPPGIVFLDSVDLSYARQYRAVEDALSFGAPRGAAVEVTGFSSPDVLLLDVTTPASPRLVAHSSAAAGGSYLVRFSATGASDAARYLALVPERAKAPLEVAASRMTALRSSGNRAEYVLIAPDSLEEAAGALADYRNGKGMTTMVVPLAAIYSEFNGGIAEPTAIREFLRYATSSWQMPPRYVTLVGRGTWDYENVMGVGDNLVPPLMAGSPNGLFASDVRLADLSGDDGVPELAIGRIPVLTAQELLDYVAKIERQESAPADPADEWQRTVLMAADNPDAGGAFTTDSDAVAALVPPDHFAQTVYLTSTTPAAGRQAILDAINGGVGIFNYIGHGGLDRLADENLWTSSDVGSLVNADRLPIFLAMTCSVGDFAIPGYPSLAEAMALKKDGGAFAAWAPTGLSENELAVRLDKSFFTAAFVRDEKVIGDIVVGALAELDGFNAVPMRYMYNLLGEPVSRLPESSGGPVQ